MDVELFFVPHRIARVAFILIFTELSEVYLALQGRSNFAQFAVDVFQTFRITATVLNTDKESNDSNRE